MFHDLWKISGMTKQLRQVAITKLPSDSLLSHKLRLNVFVEKPIYIWVCRIYKRENGVNNT